MQILLGNVYLTFDIPDIYSGEIVNKIQTHKIIPLNSNGLKTLGTNIIEKARMVRKFIYFK